MVNVEQHRSMCMIGSILALIGVIPSWLFRLVGLVGIVLILIGLKGISDATGDGRPFKNYLYSFVISIVGEVLLIVVLLTVLLSSSSFSVSVFSSPANPASFHYNGGSKTTVFGLFIGILVLAWIITIIAVHFRKKALKSLYGLTRTKEFDSAATWIWWGALTLIVIIGVVLMIVGAIYQILGFSRMPSDIEIGREEEIEEFRVY